MSNKNNGRFKLIQTLLRITSIKWMPIIQTTIEEKPYLASLINLDEKAEV